jgi:hypothetical protein
MTIELVVACRNSNPRTVSCDKPVRDRCVPGPVTTHSPGTKQEISFEDPITIAPAVIGLEMEKGQRTICDVAISIAASSVLQSTTETHSGAVGLPDG